jgi:hypothetical protein
MTEISVKSTSIYVKVHINPKGTMVIPNDQSKECYLPNELLHITMFGNQFLKELEWAPRVYDEPRWLGGSKGKQGTADDVLKKAILLCKNHLLQWMKEKDEDTYDVLLLIKVKSTTTIDIEVQWHT